VARDARGYVIVDGELRSSATGVWALGDMNGRGAFTHTAWNDYDVVAANLLDGAARSIDARFPRYALYVDPPLARIGDSERQARERGAPVLVGRWPPARPRLLCPMADAGSEPEADAHEVSVAQSWATGAAPVPRAGGRFTYQTF
jgi:hypothetical protein